MTAAHYAVEALFRYDIDEDDLPINDFVETVAVYLDQAEAKDQTLLLDMDKQTLLISLTVQVDETEGSEAQALGNALTLIRTAFHTCGGATPGWPSLEKAKPLVQLTPVEMKKDALVFA